MAELVPLNCIAYDTAVLTPGQRTVTFFHDRDHPGVDDTERGEHELVRWLSTQPTARALLTGTLELPMDTRFKLRVVEPFMQQLGGKPGDIDLLLAPPSMPHKAVALECKRVRVRAGYEDGQRVNRLEKLGHAAEQVEGLCQVGFHRTYLAVIAVVHDVSDPEYNFVFRGLREATFTRVVRFVEQLKLNRTAGVLYVEIAQPLGSSIDESGVVCAGILRPALPREQTHDTTARVQRLFADEDR